jgi:hypothetical protein
MQLLDKAPEAPTKAVPRESRISLRFVALVVALIALDFAMGSRASAAPLFVCVVVWVAWTESFERATVLGILLCVVHLARGWVIGSSNAFSMQLLNGTIRGVTLVVLAFFTSKAAWRFREMHGRIQALEQHLTICGKCALIRAEDGSWVPVESSANAGGRAGVLCPECERRSYEL